MRKLEILCRKLSRIGKRVSVVCESGSLYYRVHGSGLSGRYAVHFYDGDYDFVIGRFSGVRECEQFLLSLFR